MHIHKCIYVSFSRCLDIHTHIYMYTYIYIYVYICIYTCICTYTFIHPYILIYIYIYVYMYICIRTSTMQVQMALAEEQPPHRMSRVTHVKKSCRSCERVMSHPMNNSHLIINLDTYEQLRCDT